MGDDGSIDTESLHEQDVTWLRLFLFMEAFPAHTLAEAESTPTYAIEMLLRIKSIFRKKQQKNQPPADGGGAPATFG